MFKKGDAAEFWSNGFIGEHWAHGEHGRQNSTCLEQVKAIVDKFYHKFPFSEWEQVSKAPNGIAYTGRTIRVINSSRVVVNQRDFVEGRLAIPPMKKTSKVMFFL